jgi:hypothetical protein
VRGDDHGVVPGQRRPGERERHAGDGREHLELGGGHPLAEQAQHPEQPGVAGGQHDDVPLGLDDVAQRLGRVVPQRDGPDSLRHRDFAQGPTSTQDEAGRRQPPPREGAERRAVQPDHGDHVVTQAGTVAATTPAPAGSTIATRAGRPLNRVSTAATRAHSRSPHGRSTPAASHSS